MSQTLDLSTTSRTPFARLVKVELRKSWDTRAGIWLLAITAGLAIVVMVIAMITFAVQDLPLDFGLLMATTTYTTGLLLPILGIMLVTGEWGQRTGMVTFALEPSRTRVVLAKLVAGLLLAVVVAVIAVVAAVLSNLLYGLVSGSDISWDLGDTSLQGFVILQAVSMLTGFAIAALLLNTAAAIVVYFAYSFVLPIVFAVVAGLVGWFRDLQPWIDFANAQTPLFDWSISGVEWAHLLVSGALWLGLPLALGMVRILRAEVK
ncbi:ABC transporter permease [Nocardioides aurantiacus]|uniref:ABC-2 family transporter n=1 Tax=Nocardioides aurantiacus TaxID=86796 RepID=A0A3N2CXG8_9ACTN|nr:ABC transporter permease [Nocardioides aurantiacus]ROR91914.1 hypothetical protein EDD33_2795 [Nocardioides aurantiacus]